MLRIAESNECESELTLHCQIALHPGPPMDPTAATVTDAFFKKKKTKKLVFLTDKVVYPSTIMKLQF